MGRKSEVYGPFYAGEAEDSRYYEKTYYDKMGRVDSIESPSSQPGNPSIIDYAYPNYFTTVITDPDNKQKTEKRDHLGRIFEVIEHADAGNQSTFYWYNAAGDMLEVENALGYSTLITYDARGLKLTMDDPDMGVWYYTYDENGNLSTQTDAKQNMITFGYDVLNRVLSKNYTIISHPVEDLNYTVATPNVTYTYDQAISGLGQLYSVANTKVTTTYNEYDEMGRVVSVTKNIEGDLSRTTETEYDLSGKVTTIIHPDGFEVSNTYYPGTGLLNTVTGTPSGGSAVEYAKCTEYEPTGKIGRITHTYNDTETVYTYNLKTTRLTDLLTSGPAPGNYIIQNNSYTYSKAGDIETIMDNLKGVTYTYEYDNLHRLLGETTTDNSPPTGSEVLIYTYGDPEHINAVTSINYNGTPYNFTYDANGNMRSGYDFTNSGSVVSRGLKWNADNMPVHIEHLTNGNTDFIYDGDGARAKKVAGGTTTYYISNDYEIKNGVQTKYIFAGNLRVASIEGTNDTKIYHKDHLGSSVAITDNNAGDLETSEYLPFGGMREHTGAEVSDYKFTDQELDSESNLYNYDARLYDPVIGRFISPDVLIQNCYVPQSLNRYSYCINNPIIYNDPSGFAIETPWDIANVLMDAANIGADIATGDYIGLVIDVASTAYDGFATAVPGLPAGTGAIRTSIRAATWTTKAYEYIKTERKLISAMSNALRKEGRDILLKNSDIFANAVQVGKKLDVHHMIPLEWAHKMGKDFNPNEIANLIGVNEETHKQINKEWQAFKKEFEKLSKEKGEKIEPTKQQIQDFRDRISERYRDHFIK